MSRIPPELELTILMPCLNEAETVAFCIDKAKDYLARAEVSGEVLIADNGSTDGSQELARAHGARVVDIVEKGYGAALSGGIDVARGKFIIMGMPTTPTISLNLISLWRLCVRVKIW